MSKSDPELEALNRLLNYAGQGVQEQDSMILALQARTDHGSSLAKAMAEVEGAFSGLGLTEAKRVSSYVLSRYPSHQAAIPPSHRHAIPPMAIPEQGSSYRQIILGHVNEASPGATFAVQAMIKGLGVSRSAAYTYMGQLAKKGVVKRTSSGIYVKQEHPKARYHAPTEAIQTSKRLAKLSPPTIKGLKRYVAGSSGPSEALWAIPKGKRFSIRSAAKGSGLNYHSMTAMASILTRDGVLRRVARGKYVRVK